MPRLLLDENVPAGLAPLLVSHEARHVHDQRWAGLANGALLAAARQAGFTIMVTADRNLRYQQNISQFEIALIVLSTNNWPRIRAFAPAIDLAASRIASGEVIILDPPLLRR